MFLGLWLFSKEEVKDPGSFHLCLHGTDRTLTSEEFTFILGIGLLYLPAMLWPVEPSWTYKIPQFTIIKSPTTLFHPKRIGTECHAVVFPWTSPTGILSSSIQHVLKHIMLLLRKSECKSLRTKDKSDWLLSL